MAERVMRGARLKRLEVVRASRCVWEWKREIYLSGNGARASGGFRSYRTFTNFVTENAGG